MSRESHVRRDFNLLPPKGLAVWDRVSFSASEQLLEGQLACVDLSAATANVTITLPASPGTAGFSTDKSGARAAVVIETADPDAAYTATVVASSGDSISGFSSGFSLKDKDHRVELEFNGTEWRIVGAYSTKSVATSSSLADGASLTVTHPQSDANDRLLRVQSDVMSTGWSTVLLLNGNGTDGSTTITDSSTYAKTVTPSGAAQIDTAQSKFGGSSILFDGSADWLSLSGGSDFAFGEDDFTLEFWVRFNSSPTQQTLFDAAASGDVSNKLRIATDYFAGVQMAVFNGNTPLIIGTGNPTSGVWYHIALCRSGAVTTFYRDGVSVGSTVVSIPWAVGASRPVIGTYGPNTSSYGFNGWLDDIRVIKGHAAYTSGFTPPTSELTILNPDSYVQGHSVPGADFSVRYDDGAGADAGIKTTVTNTTGSTLTNVKLTVDVTRGLLI